VTTTTCVRASAIELANFIQSRGWSHDDDDMRVIVDLSLCGARSLNHQSHVSLFDLQLIKQYGVGRAATRSAVELAVEQMKEAGCIVVDCIDWDAWIHERKKMNDKQLQQRHGAQTNVNDAKPETSENTSGQHASKSSQLEPSDPESKQPNEQPEHKSHA